MGINNGYEWKKFQKEQEKLKKQYEEAGMTQEQIQAMYEFDLHQFKRDLAYARHTQPLLSGTNSDFDEEEGKNILLSAYPERFSVEQKSSEERKYWWLDEIGDEELWNNLKRLSEDELDLIDLFVFQELTQEEIGRILNKSQSAVAQNLKNLRKKLKKSS